MTHTHTHEPHNAGAGQGPVLLDVGEDAGALVVTMPHELDGEEIETKPAGWQPGEPLRHVGVVARPTPAGHVHSAVFGGLAPGRYDLYVRPDGPIALSVDVIAGEVTFSDWPR